LGLLPHPLETLDVLQFSLRLYKWIRYAIGIVVGALAEGDPSAFWSASRIAYHLSSSPNSLNIVDYNAGLPADSAALYYYYTNDDERRRMFLEVTVSEILVAKLLSARINRSHWAESCWMPLK
jgi:hypothetical protein